MTEGLEIANKHFIIEKVHSVEWPLPEELIIQPKFLEICINNNIKLVKKFGVYLGNTSTYIGRKK